MGTPGGRGRSQSQVGEPERHPRGNVMQGLCQEGPAIGPESRGPGAAFRSGGAAPTGVWNQETTAVRRDSLGAPRGHASYYLNLGHLRHEQLSVCFLAVMKPRVTFGLVRKREKTQSKAGHVSTPSSTLAPQRTSCTSLGFSVLLPWPAPAFGVGSAWG